MPLIPLRPLLETVDKYHYAQGAFNVNAVAQAKAAIEVHEMFRSAAILQGADLANGFMGGRTDFQNATLEDKKIGAKNIANAVKKYAEDSPIPVVLHLDHGKNFDSCKAAIEGGYTSVMIDGSHEDFEGNVAITKKVADVAKAFGVPVEAELGKVGGKEDDLEAEADTNTDPQEAKEFVERTGVTSLAIAIGTAHGFYAGTPVLDKERVSDVKKLVSAPLVLHGASGLSEEDVKECVERGMCKVNFATELRVAYTDACKKLLAEKPETFDPKKLGVVAMEAVKETVKGRMKMCGCEGKAE